MSFLRRLAISLSTHDPLVRAAKLAATGDSSIPAIIETAHAAHRAYITGMGQFARRERTTPPNFDYGDYAGLLAKLDRARVVGELMARFQGDDGEAALNAVNLLSRLRDPLCVEPLIAELNGAEADSAVRILGAVADRRAVEPLVSCLESDRISLRKLAAEALGKIGDARAVPALLRCLLGPYEQPQLTQRHVWEIRQAVAEALGKIGDRAAVAPLIEACTWAEPDYSRESDAVHAFARFHSAAVRALEQIGDVAAVPLLIETLSRTGQKFPIGTPVLGDSRQRAATALGTLRDARAVEPLLNARAERLLHKEAIDALGNFDDPRAQEAVAAALRERERCFVCGRTSQQALLPRASAGQRRRAGGDAVVASMVAYVEGIESGTAGTSRCDKCGRWACSGCLKGRQYADCPSCDRLISV